MLEISGDIVDRQPEADQGHIEIELDNMPITAPDVAKQGDIKVLIDAAGSSPSSLSLVGLERSITSGDPPSSPNTGTSGDITYPE